MVKTLQDIFRMKGYQAEVAGSASEALAKMESQQFDCVISDIKMPGTSGVELYRVIKARQPALPVVLITAYSADNLINEGLAEGVVAVLTKPLNLERLFKFLASLGQERSVVIVDDDPDFCKTLGDILQTKSFAVQQVTDPDHLLEQLKAEGQVVLLDMKLKDQNGLDVLRQIRERHPHLPVILITGYREEVAPALEVALQINAYTYLYKPLQIEELLQILTQIHHQELGRQLGQPISKKKPPSAKNTQGE
jgi:DNA-binding NtrC family response regulator